MKTEILATLYEKYKICDCKYGKINDKLGDVYEEYCKIIMESEKYLENIKKNKVTTLEENILLDILTKNNISDFENIEKIESTNVIPRRNSGGNAKTDLKVTLYLKDGRNIFLPISCKQSTVKKVAYAEFDADTICREIRITDNKLKELLLKHQTIGSAKAFTDSERKELKYLLEPIAEDLVRWVVTGCIYKNSDDIRIPSSVIKFHLKKPKDRYNIDIAKGDYDYLSYEVYTIEECIKEIMYYKNGKRKQGGFGTGLSWTYATNSKGEKIQFKA